MSVCKLNLWLAFFMSDKNIKVSLLSFLRRGFHYLVSTNELFYGWYISFLLDIMHFLEIKKTKRVIICMPPRHLKSVIISTILPAWVMGRDSTKKVIVSSYGMHLAETLAIDTRKIVYADWYKKMFPKTIWSKELQQKRKFLTTNGGFRLATSTDGSLTGEGGDLLIADDPQKPSQIFGKRYRDKTHQWFCNTFCSRLNNKKEGAIVVVMQRLHHDDLIGRLTNYEESDEIVFEANGWMVLNLALVAKRLEAFREKGKVLNSHTLDEESIEMIKREMGEFAFEAQYQQDPPKTNDGIIPKSFILTTNDNMSQEKQDGIFVSVDSAQKCGVENDSTAISFWAMKEERAVMFDCINKKMEIDELLRTLKDILVKNNVVKMLVEDKGSGTAVIQSLKRGFGSKIEAISASISKTSRVFGAMPYLENGTVMFYEGLPDEVFNQMLEFPYVKHDDVVDCIAQFVLWFGKNSFAKYIAPSVRFL